MLMQVESAWFGSVSMRVSISIANIMASLGCATTRLGVL